MFSFLSPPTKTGQPPSCGFLSLDARRGEAACPACASIHQYSWFSLSCYYFHTVQKSLLLTEDCVIFPAWSSHSGQLQWVFLFPTWIFKEKMLPCISKWCSYQAEIMASILSGRKGVQFPTEFIVEQNEKKKKKRLFQLKESSYHIQFKNPNFSLIYFFQIENNYIHLEIKL